MNEVFQKRFCEFLEVGGAEILPVTNPFEVARFKSVNGICVVYRNKKNVLSYSNDHASVATDAFLKGKKWSATAKHNRVQRLTIENKLIERDGNRCFYCRVEFSDDIPPTLEHILSVSHGGTNHFANLALCCEACNVAAGDMDIVDKLNLRRAI